MIQFLTRAAVGTGESLIVSASLVLETAIVRVVLDVERVVRRLLRFGSFELEEDDDDEGGGGGPPPPPLPPGGPPSG